MAELSTLQGSLQGEYAAAAAKATREADGAAQTHSSVCLARAVLACVPGGFVAKECVGTLLLLAHSDVVAGGAKRAVGGSAQPPVAAVTTVAAADFCAYAGLGPTVEAPLPFLVPCGYG